MIPKTIEKLATRFKGSKPRIENLVFKLHYQFTMTLLLACMLLVCAREYFKDHIKCVSDHAISEKVIENYCFVMATFTIVRNYNVSLLHSGILLHPGVGPISDRDETIRHTYYQWVPFVLFVQSICFYIPHKIWKTMEGHRIKALVDGLEYARLALLDEDMTVKGKTVPSKKTLEKKLDLVKKDIILRLKLTRKWSTWLVAMEVANLLHIMFEIWIINEFLNGAFMSLGLKVMNMREWNQYDDPLEVVFPKVTKCSFHKYGKTGSIQHHDALCVMALNIVYEKIYIILWFWFLFLFVASLLAVVWRIISYFIYQRPWKFDNFIFRYVNITKFDPQYVIADVNGCMFADWLFLYYLSKNMQTRVFQTLYERLRQAIMERNVGEVVNNCNNEANPVLGHGRVHFDDEVTPLRHNKK